MHNLKSRLSAVKYDKRGKHVSLYPSAFTEIRVASSHALAVSSGQFTWQQMRSPWRYTLNDNNLCITAWGSSPWRTPLTISLPKYTTTVGPQGSLGFGDINKILRGNFHPHIFRSKTNQKLSFRSTSFPRPDTYNMPLDHLDFKQKDSFFIHVVQI